MKHQNILSTLKQLEIELHRFSTRKDDKRLDFLLHDSFFEIGRSGITYTKSDIIKEMQNLSSELLVWSQDYDLHTLKDNTALLTYKSARITNSGNLERFCLRSSLWLLIEDDWKICFHQGTKTVPFVKNE